MTRVSNQFLLWILFALTLTGCSGGQLIVESDPVGADVSIVNPGGARTKVGKTPVTLTSLQAPALYSEGTQILVSKDGYRTESYLVPPTAVSSMGRVQATLSEDTVSKTCQDSISALAEATDAVAHVQKLIYKKDYIEAERALNNYTARFAGVPVFHSLLGNVYYLQKNLDKALDSYQRSSSLQPQNQEAARMIQKIKQIRGPSGGTN